MARLDSIVNWVLTRMQVILFIVIFVNEVCMHVNKKNCRETNASYLLFVAFFDSISSVLVLKIKIGSLLEV